MGQHADAALLENGEVQCTLTGAVLQTRGACNGTALLQMHWNGRQYRRAAGAALKQQQKEQRQKEQRQQRSSSRVETEGRVQKKPAMTHRKVKKTLGFIITQRN